MPGAQARPALAAPGGRGAGGEGSRSVITLLGADPPPPPPLHTHPWPLRRHLFLCQAPGVEFAEGWGWRWCQSSRRSLEFPLWSWLLWVGSSPERSSGPSAPGRGHVGGGLEGASPVLCLYPPEHGPISLLAAGQSAGSFSLQIPELRLCPGTLRKAPCPPGPAQMERYVS